MGFKCNLYKKLLTSLIDLSTYNIQTIIICDHLFLFLCKLKQRYNFKSIRVDFLEQFLVNGKALSACQAVRTSIYAQHKPWKTWIKSLMWVAGDLLVLAHFGAVSFVNSIGTKNWKNVSYKFFAPKSGTQMSTENSSIHWCCTDEDVRELQKVFFHILGLFLGGCLWQDSFCTCLSP